MFTGFAFLAAAVYAALTYGQWRDMKENFVMDERAWISASAEPAEFDPADYIAPGKAFMHAQLDLRNVGKTPALHMNVTGSYSVIVGARSFKLPLRFGLDIPLAPSRRHIADYWISVPSDSATGISPSGVKRGVQSGTAFVKITADVTYYDIFGFARRTQYCGTYDPRVKTFGYYGGCARTME